MKDFTSWKLKCVCVWHDSDILFARFLFSELEMQIKDIVGRIGDGHGLPWYKTQSLKTIAAEERSRIALLRVLEVRLAVRKQTDTKLSANGEIKPVVN